MNEYEKVRILELASQIKKNAKQLVAMCTEREADVMEAYHVKTAINLRDTVDDLEYRLITGSSGYVDKAWIRRVGQKLTRLARWHEEAAIAVSGNSKLKRMKKAKKTVITDGSDI